MPKYSSEFLGERTLTKAEMDAEIARSRLGPFARYINAGLSARFLGIPVADLDRDELLAVLGWYMRRSPELPAQRDALVRAETEKFRRQADADQAG